MASRQIDPDKLRAAVRRLVNRYIDPSKLEPDGKAKGNLPADGRQAFEIIFGLLDHIDECVDDVIFFADEAGSWQVGVDWNKVLSSWFRVLSATAGPEECAERITVLLEHHSSSGSEEMLTVARRTATPQQRKAISDIVNRNAGQRPRGRKV